MAVDVDDVVDHHDRLHQYQATTPVVVDRMKEPTSLNFDGVGATGQDTTSVTSPPHRLHFLTHCGAVWAGCLRDKARHCWTMFTKRKKGQFYYSFNFLL